MIWIAEQKALLAARWEAGVPTQRIADELGCSQGAVIGQAYRLDLPTHAHQRAGGKPGRRRRGPQAVACDYVPE